LGLTPVSHADAICVATISAVVGTLALDIARAYGADTKLDYGTKVARPCRPHVHAVKCQIVAPLQCVAA
jgi:hypothetical protein